MKTALITIFLIIASVYFLAILYIKTALEIDREYREITFNKYE